MPAKSAPPLAANHPETVSRPREISAPEIECGAVVLTVSVEVPVAFGSDAALKAQVGAGVAAPVTRKQE